MPPNHVFRRAIALGSMGLSLAGVLVLAFLMPTGCFAQELTFPTLYGPSSAELASGSSEALGALGFEVDSGGTRDVSLDATPSVGADEVPPFSFTWEKRPNRSYLIPALEIPLYVFLLNQFEEFHGPTGGVPHYRSFNQREYHGWEMGG
ncbi:MAG: hypothetical protein H0X47_04585 [Nitrospirales bacterium]|nr:hypothetical protein [Nitrospirales bacterium]